MNIFIAFTSLIEGNQNCLKSTFQSRYQLLGVFLITGSFETAEQYRQAIKMYPELT